MITAIIGIGSPFGEDQAGWDAVDALAGEAWVQARLAAGTLVLEKLDRPGMALLDHLRGHAHVILIDAVLSAEHCPGTWLALPREELALLAFPASSHGIGVAEALAMGETLGMLPEKLEIWGIVVPELC
ncbi:hydrogenase maturation protease [Thiothrix lacustris]|uniref:Hydrogenase maturation protease n=1 Tax=Thiothrix lacustris TaxID=525917 RepID=A0ABY9MTT5_9GAMM|nr:hydrogenase maturation protease [Thiothrix lacustris]WML92067.1 hydrogenase maturation protease [Thiothrix lacustris]